MLTGNSTVERAAVHAALGDPVRLAMVDELAVSDRSPVELRHLVDVESNLLAHHLDVLEGVELIERTRSSGDGRRRYVRLVRDHLHGLAPGRPVAIGPALFVCTANSARSQLAAALWRKLAEAPADSAGTHPAERVHRAAAAAAQRAGLDLADATPRELAADATLPPLVVTVCDRAHEEVATDGSWLHWSIADPVAIGTADAFDATVDELRERISSLLGAGTTRIVIDDPLHPTDRELSLEVETGTGALRLDLTRRLAAEALGTAFLIVAVIGSGIMASRLSPTDLGMQLLANSAATAAALIGLILMFGAVSGAHLNPVVTLTDRLLGTISTRDAALYVVAQVLGGCAGALVANVMFELPVVELSTTDRSSPALWLSEVVATVGLLLVIQGCVRTGRGAAVPFAVGAWIGGAYWFTSSTSFANPAVTVARTLSDSFAGIAPASAPMFIAMQLVGAAVAYGLIRLFYPHPHAERSDG